ncbi:MAG: amidase [Verrucomicrobia bacterium]|nr:amidase [Verrucomicrobiota bacterium]
MKRRHFILSSSAAALAACDRRSAFQELDMTDTLRDLKRGRLSSVQLMQHYLQRLKNLDRAGPELRSVTELHPDARQMATRADSEKSVRLLDGLPILIKDNIETADGMLTTAGSLALVEAPPPSRDAEIVRRLREAGALLFGKTNLSEWANIRSRDSSSGWSARGGLTKNPHRLSHSASGSSSGSAVAVAAGFCAAAIGTETNGSIVSPASACGIVGLKPTLGKVSRSGIIPISHWQDTAGPMTRTVRDAALLMNVLSGYDARDLQSVEAPASALRDHLSLLRPEALRGVRLGIVRDLCGTHLGVQALFDQALDHLRAAGAVIVDSIALPDHRRASGLAWRCLLTEFRIDLNAYLNQRGGKVRSLADLIAFNNENRETEMPFFGQDLFEEAERRGSDEALAEALELRPDARQLAGPSGIDQALMEHRLDALICPTNDPAQRITLDQGDDHVRVASGPAAVAGYPHLTVPMGLVGGLPIGLSFMGAAWSEARLLGYGYAFESLLPAWTTRQPLMRP